MWSRRIISDISLGRLRLRFENLTIIVLIYLCEAEWRRKQKWVRQAVQMNLEPSMSLSTQVHCEISLILQQLINKSSPTFPPHSFTHWHSSQHLPSKFRSDHLIPFSAEPRTQNQRRDTVHPPSFCPQLEDQRSDKKDDAYLNTR